MRRPLRWLVNGLGKALCLLSLLACVGVAWLWWRGGRTGRARVEVTAAHVDLEATSTPQGLWVRMIGRWPEGGGAWAGEGEDAARIVVGQNPEQIRDSGRLRFGGTSFTWGRIEAEFHRDGTPKRLSPMEQLLDLDGFDVLWTGPLPFLSVSIPNPIAAFLFALPPLLWLALRYRRLYARRRRRRLGLCLACGYDLRGNTSGKCSECGEAVEVVRRLTT